jgi:hypothetical protein
MSTFFDAVTSTRKCDCILSEDGFEVANFEEFSIQLQKKIKIDKSVLLHLERYE